MAALAFAPGELLAGKYRVERMLGEGGYGVVIAAEHIALGGRVAIKVLRPEMAKDQEVVERFLREGRAAVRIKGEHVTRVLDVGELPSGVPYMVMEYLDGQDLGQIVDTQGPLPIPVAVDYLLQACEALAEAHGLGIIHRDIKPSNLFLTLTADGSSCIKVLDFGISKLVATDDAESTTAKLTQTQAIIGSPQYMAPEQMRTSRPVDRRTDIWALGGTLFELLTGRPPFDASTIAEIFAQILEDAPPNLTGIRSDAPPELAHVIIKCLEKQPDRRFDNVNHLALALAPFSSNGDEATGRIKRVALRASASHVSERVLPIATPTPTPAAPRTMRLATPPMTPALTPAPPPRRGGWTVPLLLGLLCSVIVLVVGLTAFKTLRRTPVAKSAPTVSAPPPVESPTPTGEPPPIPQTGVAPEPASSVEPPVSAVTTKHVAPAPRPHLKPSAAPAPKPSGVASSRYD